jgi:hypothetical protein
VVVEWNCIACERLADPIVVGPNPLTGVLGFNDGWHIYLALGLTAIICPTIATEETSWGKVKALYEE